MTEANTGQDKGASVHKTRMSYWLPVLAWMAVIYLFSDQPYSGQQTAKFLGALNVLVRKLAHLSEYAVLFALIARAWGASLISQAGSCRACLAGFIVSILYALSDEWHQSFVPGRTAAASDVLIDASGCFLAYLIWCLADKFQADKRT